MSLPAKSILLACFLGILLSACFTERGQEGELLYGRHCASCHLENGEGLRGVIPPLVNSDYVEKNRDLLACLIKKGIQGPILVNGKQYNQAMPGNPQLTEADLTNIINYLHKEFKSPQQRVSFGEIREQVKNCP
ncbi:cytochrome c [Rufibacter immobilis]|uniref:Cytochrome c n=1 Tax=Rufibacter immobilis TaxID=1348778 RepID=A0A3M9N3N3_9BACT|nr:cytochrome c [Rufibacter immobilis]RNI31917.1 cytochrome c [Rufibacter immobilis]